MIAKEKAQGLAVGIALVLVLGVLLATADWVERRPAVVTPSEQSQLEATAIAFVKTLPAYEQQAGSPSIVLQSMQIIQPDLWLAQLQTQTSASDQVYSVELQHGQVIQHSVTLMDPQQVLAVYSPEPEVILGNATCLVKGKTKADAPLTIQILPDGSTSQIMKVIRADDNGVFSQSFASLKPGHYQVSVISGTAIVKDSFVVASPV